MDSMDVEDVDMVDTGSSPGVRQDEDETGNNPLGLSSASADLDHDVRDILVPPVLESAVAAANAAGDPENLEFSDSKKFWFWKKTLKESISDPDQDRETEENDRTLSVCKPHAMNYNMNHRNRGKVLIFNHRTFDSHQRMADRMGTDVDRDCVKDVFVSLGFDPLVYNDLKYVDMQNVLVEVANAKEYHNTADCLAVVVMSHGQLDKIHAYDKPYKSEVLWSHFTADKCPQLAGKPKMFFIQACRGDKYDDGFTLRQSRTVVDGPADTQLYRIPNQADFLTVFSTAPAFLRCPTLNDSFLTRVFQYLSVSNSGYYSWRNGKRGSCFIQALCRVLNKYAYEKDLLSMVTIVNCEVAINYESNVPTDVTQHQKKQVPHVSHTLTRLIQLTQKNQNGLTL